MSTLKITEAETSTALSGGASKVVVSEQVLVIAPQTGPPLDSSVPLMDGTAAAGSSTSSAHGDHRHPTDTSRAATAHAHAESDVTNLVTDLSAKADLSTVAAALALKAPLASPSFTGKVGLPSLPDAPGSPSAGDMYFDSALGQLRYYDGSGWDTVVCAEDAQTIPGVKTFTGNPVFNDGAIPEAKVAGLITDLAAKADSAWATKSTTYTAAAGDHVIDVTGTTTINLPAAASNTGRVFVIRNTGGAAVTIDGNGAETVGGAATQAFTGYGYLQIVSNGSNWLILDGRYWSEAVGRTEYVWNHAYNSATGGWQLVYGDTGWRDVSASMTTPTHIQTLSSLLMRRVGQTVYVTARGTVGTGTIVGTTTGMGLLNVASGFQPNDFVTVGAGTNNFRIPVIPNFQSSKAALVAHIGAGSTWNAAVFDLSASWATSDAWPATLPGSASGSIPFN